MDIQQVALIFNKQRWIFARTMPDNPHEYCLRKNFERDEDFVKVVEYIRANGTEEMFEGYPYTCLYLDGHKYWTMGEPIDIDGMWHTILINRAKI